MKTYQFAIVFAAVAAASVTAQAHEVWVQAPHLHGGEVLNANLGYGDFPILAEIAEDRLHIFKKPMQLHSPQGSVDLKQAGEHNYQYVSEQGLAEGSYLVTAEYSPTFWSKNAEGWKQVNMIDMPDATYCEQTRMYGKHILNVGHHPAHADFVTKPLGQGLEIVPAINPMDAKVGEGIPMKLLFNGEPLSGETVVGTFEGFTIRDPNDKVHKVEPQAFSDTTRPDGTFKLYALREGFWKLRVVHKSDYPEPETCQQLASYATLSFYLGSAH